MLNAINTNDIEGDPYNDLEDAPRNDGEYVLRNNCVALAVCMSLNTVVVSCRYHAHIYASDLTCIYQLC